MSLRKRLVFAAAFAALGFTTGASALELFQPGAESDPRLRSAAFLAEDKRHFTALSELLQMNPSGDYTRMPADYQWVLAQAYLSFGMKAKSEEVYRNIALTTKDEVLMAKTRLRLAEFEYQRGYLDEARATLYGMREKMPDNMVEDWQDLLARVLMSGGRYPEALEILTDLKNGDKQSPYTRYNLGVAMVNTGDIKTGRAVIDRVGRMRVSDVETMAFRDKANMSLGWHYLKDGLAGNAKQVFYRVRSAGPFSNRSLLGLGWSELAPSNSAKTANIPDDITPFSTFATLAGSLNIGGNKTDKTVKNFKLGQISPEEQAALQRAMVAWVELIGRDQLDPAVQEAWLAIPYALDRLGAHTEALQYYEKAVDKLEDTRKRLDLASASVKRGVMVETLVRRDLDSEAGWGWRVRDLPDVPETYYLQSLLAEHRFQEALKNYRDVRLMGRTLDAWKARLAKLEADYAAREQLGASPTTTIKRAKQDWVEPWKKINIPLRLESHLSPSADTDAPFTPPPVQVPPLQLAEAPARFDGAGERIEDLRSRIANLRELTTVAGAQQAKLLESIATQELATQKKQVEKYLVEARFALARLYDRELRKVPDAAPEPLPEGGLLQKFLGVFGAKPLPERKK